MRKSYLAWIVASLVILGLVLVFVLHSSSPTPVSSAPSIPVTVAAASRQDVPVFLVGLGNVQAFNTVTVRAQIDGQLQKIAFKEGQDVHVGDLLAQIDPRTYQAALDQAVAKKAEDEAQLANARLDLQRYAGLVEKNYVARQQLDTTQALVAQLTATVQGDQAAIENARVLLGYTSITAPIEARTGIRLVDVGNIVHAADAGGIVVLTQLHPIAVVFTLPEDSVPRLLKAMKDGALPVSALSRDGQQRFDQGVLELVDNQIDQTTGTVRLKAIMPNHDGLLWPGQFVNAKVLLETLKNKITVPVNAIQRGPQGAFGFVVTQDGTVDVRKLTLGEISEGLAVIEGGIGDGERVVTAGQFRLQQGTHVQVATTAESAR
jgi:multidrug efflux system membrane fusion protein